MYSSVDGALDIFVSLVFTTQAQGRRATLFSGFSVAFHMRQAEEMASSPARAGEVGTQDAGGQWLLASSSKKGRQNDKDPLTVV